MFTHQFAPDTTKAQALAEIAQLDLPADATLVASKMGDGCELFLYVSAALASAEPDLGSHISFDLHSPGDGTTYVPDQAEGADLSAAPDLGSC